MEMASVYAAEMSKTLLSVIALTNMYRVNGRSETREIAAQWLPTLERQLDALKTELRKTDYDTR